MGKIKSSTIGYVVIIALLAITSFFSIDLFFKERTSHDKLDIRKLPYQIGQWRGEDLEITEREYGILETRNLVFRKYVNPSKEEVLLFIVYSETNRSVFHPPEMCLLGEGLRMVDKTKEYIDLKGHKVSVNKLYLEKDNYKELMLYCYKAGNMYTSNFYLQQTYLAVHQIFGKGLAGAAIRVDMPLAKDEQATLTTMKDFLKESIKTLEALR